MTRMMHALPVEAYTSQKWFDREHEVIFSRTWRFAGFVEDVAEPGDLITAQLGLNSIFIVKGPDHRLRAFHNICRHRGTRLVREAGKVKKTLICPYHEWTYDLAGRLIHVPDEQEGFPGLDKSCLGLKPAAMAIWRGMIFVHPDADAGSISGWFGEIEPYLGPHKVEELTEYLDAAASYEIQANWKLVVENYIDVCNLAHLRSHTRSMYDHTKADYGFVGPHYAFWEPPTVDYSASIEKNAGMPLVISKEEAGSWVSMLFPGLGLSESTIDWSVSHIVPLSPERTRVDTRTRVNNVSSWAFQRQEGRSTASFWSKNLTGRGEVRQGRGNRGSMMSGCFTEDDIDACEQQQRSLRSSYFEVGAAAQAAESPVREHQKVVLDYLKGRR